MYNLAKLHSIVRAEISGRDVVIQYYTICDVVVYAEIYDTSKKELIFVTKSYVLGYDNILEDIIKGVYESSRI